MNPEDQNISILLIEDNRADVYLFKSALAELEVPSKVEVFGNGTDAMNHLHRISGGKAEKPDLLILDLNLPGVNGREILEEMSQNAPLRDVPVAVFSGSAVESGITEEFPELRLMFAVKPYDYEELKETLAAIREFAEHTRAEQAD